MKQWILKKTTNLVDVLIDIIFIFSVMILLSMGVSKFVTGSASIFGFRPMRVMSDSMEPVLMTGDIVLGRIVAGQDITIGNIYTYRSKDLKGITVIHRVYEARSDGYIFWGDNNEAPDPLVVPPEDISFEIIWYPSMKKG